MSPTVNPNLPHQGRQARSRAARAAVREHALRLFLRDGYSSTTVEMIADTAGISRRTFFRYFPSKEDVVVMQAEDLSARVVELVRERDLGEAPLASILAALQPIIAEYARDPVRTRALLRLTFEAPELRARSKDLQDAWSRALAAEVAARHPARGPLFADVLGAVAQGALQVALSTWLVHGGDLHKLVADAFGQVARIAEPDRPA